MTILLLVIVFLVLFLVFASLVVLVIGPIMLLQPHRRTIEFYRKLTPILHPADLKMACEEMTIKTAEGIPLACWLLKTPHASKGSVIILHGVSECKIVGLPLAKRLVDVGFNVFLYDSRRHGESGGHFCTYGFYEKHDVSTAITYLFNRPDIRVGRVGLLGTSMGAAVAIQVAALDSRVVAVVAESGFASLRTVYDEYQKRIIKLPWHYLRNIVIKRSEHIAHFRASLVSPVEAAKEIHIPLFLLHGTADTNIKPISSQMVFRNAQGPKELWMVPGATHSNMAEKGGDEYERRIVEFFQKHLPT